MAGDGFVLPAARRALIRDGSVGDQPGQKLLLSIIELGGYPNFRPVYESLGYEVIVETRMRKAIAGIRRRCPDVIVAEYNFQSDFRDRTSSLESLLAVVQRLPGTRVIVFYEEEFSSPFNKLRDRLPVHHALRFPVLEADLRKVLLELAARPPVGTGD
jgi:hypothetical protein